MNFYEGVNKLQPHNGLVKFVRNHPNIKTAIDLGCGAGRDTKFLVKNGINVTAIDRADVRKFLYEGLEENEKERINFVQTQFSDVQLPKADLVISYEAIQFCDMETLKSLINKIKSSLNKNGYFLCDFLGTHDSGFGNGKKIMLFDKKEIEKLLDGFEIIEIYEMEKDGETAMHQVKHWHVFWVIAQKI